MATKREFWKSEFSQMSKNTNSFSLLMGLFFIFFILFFLVILFWPLKKKLLKSLLYFETDKYDKSTPQI